ncbi:MAG: glycosyltransferase family 4 protein [Thermodesulfobacteriota bacterium]|nr:glycosyltransferase family 4 protein [Thermodesulfobacteriota bacterium]
MKELKIAFCLFKYFPYGGLQKNLLQIAEVCVKHGHQVDVYSCFWTGDIPEDLRVSILPVRGFSNHRRLKSFARRLGKVFSSSHYDCVVGFNKLPGLDVYYAGESCLAAKAHERSIWYRLTGRCRTFLRFEKAVFGKESKTQILLISEQEKALYTLYYGTPERRFHFLPPGLGKDLLASQDSTQKRAELCYEFSIGLDQNIILMVGSGFKTKGVDRAIRAIASLPSEVVGGTILLVVGEDKTRPFRRLAKRLGVEGQMRFAGGRGDVDRFYRAADLLIHPAYRENTGTALIEAMAAGLPVLATDVCGYGFHIERAGAGKLVPSPFRQETLDQMLAGMLVSEKKNQWQSNGKEYVANMDVFSRPEKAAGIIEQVATW